MCSPRQTLVTCYLVRSDLVYYWKPLLIVTSKKMVDPSQYLVTDGHIYKRIEMPNAPSKQWRLEELDIEEAIRSMISDFGGRSDEP